MEIDAEEAQALILALNAELLAGYPEDGTSTHFRLEADEVAHGRRAFLVIYSDGAPIGCGAVRLLDVHTAEIKRMYVRPSSRGMGLGRRLLAALEAEARDLGVKKLVLETGPRQPEAIALYKRGGYSKTAAFGEHLDSPLSVFMKKEIN